MRDGLGEDSKHIFNHSPGLWDRAAKAADNFEGVTCAVLAAASVEALPHDLVAYLQALELHAEVCLNNPKNRSRNQGAVCLSPIGHELSSTESALLSGLISLENNRSNTIQKLRFLWETCGRQWDDKLPMIKDLTLLIDVRNAVVHPKPELITGKMKNGFLAGQIKGYPDIVGKLVQRKLITQPKGHSSWLNVLDTKENDELAGPNKICNWLMNVSQIFLDETLTMLPNTALCKAFSKSARLL